MTSMSEQPERRLTGETRSASGEQAPPEDHQHQGAGEGASDLQPQGAGEDVTAQGPHGDDDAPRSAPSEEGGTRTPISTRSRVLIAVLCGVLGFGIAIQVRQTQDDEFAALRQDDLVRLLDEVTQRNDDLVAERDQLLRDRSALRSGSDAQQLAAEYQLVHGVLAGTEPVEGPGVVVTVENAGQVSAQTMVHMLEELRNAGAEAVEVSGQRLIASSAFVDTPDGVLVDGQRTDDPMEWRAIGDPDTMAVALNIPGGALTGFRNAGAVVDLEQRDLVQITAIREVFEPEYAAPAETEE